MHQAIILLRSAAPSLILHLPLRSPPPALPRPPHPAVWMSPLILSPLSSPPMLPAALAIEMPLISFVLLLGKGRGVGEKAQRVAVLGLTIISAVFLPAPSLSLCNSA